ncbi:MAG: alcohol dehydrogenase catalytic domain-containing protein, partial [Enterococcus faecium]
MSEKELMKVVGFYEGLPIDDPKSFMDEKEQVPVPTSQDLLVKVNAVSVNPVDTKLRQDNGIRNALRILGFDGVGKVVAVGDEVQKFSVGDRVFYAGTTTRAGSNQE